eukprot:13114679-Ditylum_brightwellii.AAC.1
MKAAEFMVHYRKMTPVCQKVVLNEWANISWILEECDNSSHSDNLMYILPSMNAVTENGHYHPICRNALLGFLGVGRTVWENALKDPLKEHGFKGGEETSIKCGESKCGSDEFYV